MSNSWLKLDSVGFSGRFGTPLKRLWMHPTQKDYPEVYQQLTTLGNRYEFDVVTIGEPPAKPLDRKLDYKASRFSRGWPQDRGVFIPDAHDRHHQHLGLYAKVQSKRMSELKDADLELAQGIEIHGGDLRFIDAISDGADLMIGQRKSGEPFAIVNTDQLPTMGKLALQTGLKRQQIFGLPSLSDSVLPRGMEYIGEHPKNGHMDLEICPISESVCTIRDFTLGQALMEQALKDTRSTREQGFIQEVLGGMRQYFRKFPVQSIEPHIQALKRAGFEHIIPIPGGFPNGTYEVIERGDQPARVGVNFMNSVIQRLDHHRVLFMTNDSGLPTVNRLFETYLKEKVPEVAEVAFVAGKRFPDGGNTIGKGLAQQGGGLHCRVIEQPEAV